MSYFVFRDFFVFFLFFDNIVVGVMDVVDCDMFFFSFSFGYFDVFFVVFFSQSWKDVMYYVVIVGGVDFQVGILNSFFDVIDIIFIEWCDKDSVSFWYLEIGELLQWGRGIVVFDYEFVKYGGVSMFGVNSCEFFVGMVDC